MMLGTSPSRRGGDLVSDVLGVAEESSVENASGRVH
jgi:hypothetical protein